MFYEYVSILYTIVVLTSHDNVFFGLVGVIFEIFCCNFAFIANFYHRKKITTFQNCDLKDKTFLYLNFMDLGLVCYV